MSNYDLWIRWTQFKFQFIIHLIESPIQSKFHSLTKLSIHLSVHLSLYLSFHLMKYVCSLDTLTKFALFKETVELNFKFLVWHNNSRAYSKTHHVFRMWNFNLDMAKNPWKSIVFFALESTRLNDFHSVNVSELVL